MDQLKARNIAALLLFLFLFLIAPAFCREGLHVKKMGSEVYVIDYRGPETHRYLPPPDQAGYRPKTHHQTQMAPHGKNGKKIPGR